MRGLAALLVVIYHMPHWHTVMDGLPVVASGDRMVPLFFVLSGFVIHRAYAGRIARAGDLGRFLFLRIGRLYPVHLLFLVLFLGLEVAKLATVGLHDMGFAEAPFSRNSLTALFEQVLLIQAYGLTDHALTWNGPAWSISVEMATYAMFGMALLVLGRRTTTLFGGAAAAGLGALALLPVGEAYWLLNGVAGFSIGCLTAQAVHRWPLSIPGWAPALVGAVLVGWLAWHPRGVHLLAIYPLAALLVAAIAWSREGPFGATMRHRWLVGLGAVSYSVYMSHMFVFWCITLVLKRVLHRPPHADADGILVPTLGPIETAVAVAGSLALVLLLSAAVYRWVEQPCRAWSRRVAGRVEARPASPVPHHS